MLTDTSTSDYLKGKTRETSYGIETPLPHTSLIKKQNRPTLTKLDSIEVNECKKQKKKNYKKNYM
jgi:hypothetical protein